MIEERTKKLAVTVSKLYRRGAERNIKKIIAKSHGADIAAVLGSAESPHEMSQHLIELANGRGGRDNVSVIVVKAQEPPRKPGMMAKLLRK